MTNYRDNLARKLRELRSSEDNPRISRRLARTYRDAIVTVDPQYKAAREEHRQKISHLHRTLWRKIDADDRFCQEILDKYVAVEKEARIRQKMPKLPDPEREAADRAYEVLPACPEYGIPYKGQFREPLGLEELMCRASHWRPSQNHLRVMADVHDAYDNTLNRIKKENEQKTARVKDEVERSFDQDKMEQLKEEILDGMRAIDEAYKNGLFGEGLQCGIPENTSRAQYDFGRVSAYKDTLWKRMAKLYSIFEYDTYRIGARVGIPQIEACKNESHDWESLIACSNYSGWNIAEKEHQLQKERVQQFLERFRRTS